MARIQITHRQYTVEVTRHDVEIEGTCCPGMERAVEGYFETPDEGGMWAGWPPEHGHEVKFCPFCGDSIAVMPAIKVVENG